MDNDDSYLVKSDDVYPQLPLASTSECDHNNSKSPDAETPKQPDLSDRNNEKIPSCNNPSSASPSLNDCFKTPSLPHRKRSPGKGATSKVAATSEHNHQNFTEKSDLPAKSSSSASASHSAEKNTKPKIEPAQNNPNESSTDNCVRIGKNSYICPRTRLYLNKRFKGLDPRRRDDYGTAIDDDLTKEIIIDGFSILLFQSQSDYNRLKNAEARQNKMQSLKDQEPSCSYNEPRKNRKNKAKKHDVRHKEKERNKVRRRKSKDIKPEQLGNPSLIDGNETVVKNAQDSVTDENDAGHMLIVGDKTGIEVFPNHTIGKKISIKNECHSESEEQVSKTIINQNKRPSSTIGIAKNGLISDHTLLEKLPAAKIPKIESNDGTCKSELNQLNSPTTSDAVKTTNKDNYIKPSTSMSENNVTSVSSPIRKQFGAINDMQGSLKQQFLYNPDVLQNYPQSVAALKPFTTTQLPTNLTGGINPAYLFPSTLSQNTLFQSQPLPTSIAQSIQQKLLLDALASATNKANSNQMSNSNSSPALPKAATQTYSSSASDKKSTRWCRMHITIANEIGKQMEIAKKVKERANKFENRNQNTTTPLCSINQNSSSSSVNNDFKPPNEKKPVLESHRGAAEPLVNSNIGSIDIMELQQRLQQQLQQQQNESSQRIGNVLPSMFAGSHGINQQNTGSPLYDQRLLSALTQLNQFHSMSTVQQQQQTAPFGTNFIGSHSHATPTSSNQYQSNPPTSVSKVPQQLQHPLDPSLPSSSSSSSMASSLLEHHAKLQQFGLPSSSTKPPLVSMASNLALAYPPADSKPQPPRQETLRFGGGGGSITAGTSDTAAAAAHLSQSNLNSLVSLLTSPLMNNPLGQHTSRLLDPILQQAASTSFDGQQTALLQLLSQLTPSGSVPAHLVQQLLPLFAVNGNNANLNSLQHQLLDSLPAHNQISNKKQHMVPPFYDAERFLPVSSNASSLLSPHLLATNPLNGCINSGELYSGLLTSLLQNQVNPKIERTPNQPLMNTNLGSISSGPAINADLMRQLQHQHANQNPLSMQSTGNNNLSTTVPSAPAMSHNQIERELFLRLHQLQQTANTANTNKASNLP